MWADIVVLTIKCSDDDQNIINSYIDDLIWVTKSQSVKFNQSTEFSIEITL
jgi:hypothetical protein